MTLGALALVGCASIIGSDFGDYRVAGPDGGSHMGGDHIRDGGASSPGGGGSAGTGGGAPFGGATASGGAQNAGGTGPGSGGTNPFGGSNSSGGTNPFGGSNSSGGTNPFGGSNSSGGLQGAGGSVAGPPIALFLMVDRSGSMTTGYPEGSAQSWANSTAGIQAFLADPGSQSLDVGLGFFPTAPANGWLCGDGSGSGGAGSDCGVPAVEIGAVPTTALQINTAMTNGTPNPLNFTPTECALLGIVSHCRQWRASTGERCAGVLVTDGSPTMCDTTTADLLNILSGGAAEGTLTFVLGLPGANFTLLDQFAQAGGTTKSIDVTAGSAAFGAALQSIPQRVP